MPFSLHKILTDWPGFNSIGCTLFFTRNGYLDVQRGFTFLILKSCAFTYFVLATFYLNPNTNIKSKPKIRCICMLLGIILYQYENQKRLSACVSLTNFSFSLLLMFNVLRWQKLYHWTLMGSSRELISNSCFHLLTPKNVEF